MKTEKNRPEQEDLLLDLSYELTERAYEKIQDSSRLQKFYRDLSKWQKQGEDLINSIERQN